MLAVENASFGYRRRGGTVKTVLADVSFTLEPGELLCVLGANGVGKTTMYRTILGFLPLLGGRVAIDGTDADRIPRSELARRVAYVPQYHAPPFPYTVFDVVLMGRGAHLSAFAQPKREDEEIALRMLDRMGILRLKDEVYTELSGGERQLTLIARALCQQSDYLLMDEPTASLDFGNQHRLLGEIRGLADEGFGVCFTSHYPDHAFQTGATVLALEDRDHWTLGPAEELITAERLGRMYGLRAQVRAWTDPNGARRRQVVVDPTPRKDEFEPPQRPETPDEAENGGKS